MFKKGQKINFEVVDMSIEGHGIGRAEGMIVFVPGAVVGDKVTAEIIKIKKRYIISKLISIDINSPHRAEPICMYSEECGGCPLACMDYKGRLEMKERQVREKLSHLGKVKSPLVRKIVGMEPVRNGYAPGRYRNKASLSVSIGDGMVGKCSIGFFRIKSHEVVDVSDCRIQAAPVMAAAYALKRYMVEDNISAWDPESGKGLIRHIIVRTCFGTGEVMIILVINGNSIPNAEKFIEYADDAVFACNSYRDEGVNTSNDYSLESVVLNINTKNTRKIMGEESVTLAGKSTVNEVIGSMKFEISPMSFFQVNPVQMEKLYVKAAEYADLSGSENVLDLYCGTGTIGLSMAGRAANVLGIDSVKQAVLDANRNAVINGIVNARFLCGRAEQLLPALLESSADRECQALYEKFDDEIIRTAQNADVVILDPPRAGCKPELLEAVGKAMPSRIVYVSCDLATLARDVKILNDYGYLFVEATPFDMFPDSVHVETVCLMSRNRD